MSQLCPLNFLGQTNQTYNYTGLICPGGANGFGSDTRPHRLGFNCDNIVDAINQGGCADPLGIRPPPPPDYLYSLELAKHGIPKYTTLDAPFYLAGSHVKVVGDYIAEYVDEHQKEGIKPFRLYRKVRLLAIQAQMPASTTVLTVRIGEELAPETPLDASSMTRLLQATLDKSCSYCHYHRIQINKDQPIEAGEFFHVTLKGCATDNYA
jgi:hypothetical protein